MVGSAIVRSLLRQGAQAEQLLLRSSKQLDLKNQLAVQQFFHAEQPDQVYLAAARVGGIHANDTEPASFLYDNLMIEANVIDAAHQSGAKKLLFLGSSCIYPREAPQPMSEDALLSGPLEPTNQWYAIAKIAGIKLCQAYRRQYGVNFISAMPTNLYGPGDNFHPLNSHVPAALLTRIHEAKQNDHPIVTIWGTGSPLREFMHVDDLADACLHLMETYEGEEPINIGSGDEISIQAFAELMKQTVGYEGGLEFDTTKPDGTPRKLMDSSRLSAIGWQPKISLHEGLKDYYNWFLNNQNSLRR